MIIETKCLHVLVVRWESELFSKARLMKLGNEAFGGNDSLQEIPFQRRGGHISKKHGWNQAVFAWFLWLQTGCSWSEWLKLLKTCPFSRGGKSVRTSGCRWERVLLANWTTAWFLVVLCLHDLADFWRQNGSGSGIVSLRRLILLDHPFFT